MTKCNVCGKKTSECWLCSMIRKCECGIVHTCSNAVYCECGKEIDMFGMIHHVIHHVLDLYFPLEVVENKFWENSHLKEKASNNTLCGISCSCCNFTDVRQPNAHRLAKMLDGKTFYGVIYPPVLCRRCAQVTNSMFSVCKKGTN